MPIPPVDPFPSEKDALVRLAKGVVLAQGNRFIKELLRMHDITIGTTKSEFEQNMVDAIQTGTLRRDHIESWLNEVEGWGDQHVYLFRVPKKISKDIDWDDADEIKSKILKAGFGNQWSAKASLEYPAAHKLVGIYFREHELTFAWHKGTDFFIRRKDRDYREEIDGDTYEFRANRLRADRKVTRFVLRPRDSIAAVFLQIAFDEDEHKTAFDDVKRTISRVWSFDELEPLAIASTIKKLDTRSLEKKNIAAHSTRLDGKGAYVEFGSTSAGSSYQDFAAVRKVRLAVQSASFTGMNGTFTVSVTDVKGEQRQIRVHLYGEQRRVKLSSQMTSTEVWDLLQLIRENT